jgi:hypothetical protein
MDAYIQNKGIMKTLVHNQGHNSISKVGWNANYDGNLANISLGINHDGKIDQYQIQLDNEDLEQLLSVPSVNRPLDQRLTHDFDFDFAKKKEPIFITFEKPRNMTRSKRSSEKKYTHLSSPRTREQLIIPLAVKKKTPKRRTRRSYRIYKIPKQTSSARRTRRSIRHSF